MGLAISPSFNRHLQGSKVIILTLKLEKGVTQTPLLFKVTQSLGGKTLGHWLVTIEPIPLELCWQDSERNPCQIYC